jgi:hypothetical protein
MQRSRFAYDLTMEASGLVYFMHIEKNAGTTVRHILRKNYPAGTFLDTRPLSRMGGDGRAKTVDGLDEDVHQVIDEIQNRQHTLACVAANLPFGVDNFLARPVTYFTFLREPVSRCVSCWYFAFQTRHTAPMWSVLESYDFDLRQILQDNVVYQFSNDQVRMLSGSSAPEPGEAEFQMACDIVEERFFLAGAVEYFDRCIEALACQFRWQQATSLRLNVGVKTGASILPSSAERYFREANEWDVKLYDWLLKEYLPCHLS